MPPLIAAALSSPAFQPQQVLVHTCIPRNKAPRGTEVWCSKGLSDSRGS